jgi:mono/diheme cytochrome c family protein
MNIPAIAVVALALAAVAPPVAAHGVMSAWYGGQIAETADGLRVEFAVRDGGIRAWVRDHDDRAVAASGKATLLVDGRKTEAAFAADGPSLFAAAGVRSADRVAAILSLTVDGKPVSVRFGQEAVAVPALQPQAQAGKAVFDKVCAVCHGTALRGSDQAPPLLHPMYAPGSGHGDDVVLSAIAKGAAAHMWKFGDMPKPEGVKAGQERDILAYVRAMQDANGLGKADAPMGHAGHH